MCCACLVLDRRNRKEVECNAVVCTYAMSIRYRTVRYRLFDERGVLMMNDE